MKYVKPIKLGKLSLSSNIWYAPLAGCSDFPFRQIATKYHPGLMFCEMVKMDALIRREPNTFRLLDYSKDMHPIGGQICGSKPEIAGDCAKIIEDLGFDVVDLNCGCPVDKVTKDNSGSGLLKFPKRIGEILHQMVSSVSIPVTVKIRAGWDEESINASLITEIAEQAGAKAITIHGRTRKQAYKGSANWDHIKVCKEKATSIKVIGNGDVFSAQDAIRLFEHTHCDGVLVSRGSLKAPWIAENIRRLENNKPLIEENEQFYKERMLKHLAYVSRYQVEKKAITDMRRISCWYLKEQTKAKSFREKLNKCTTIEEMKQLIDHFSWEAVIAS